jgi:hypothetical protein
MYKRPAIPTKSNKEIDHEKYTLRKMLEDPVICNLVVQIAALKQPVYCAQFPAIFQG